MADETNDSGRRDFLKSTLLAGAAIALSAGLLALILEVARPIGQCCR